MGRYPCNHTWQLKSDRFRCWTASTWRTFWAIEERPLRCIGGPICFGSEHHSLFLSSTDVKGKRAVLVVLLVPHEAEHRVIWCSTLDGCCCFNATVIQKSRQATPTSDLYNLLLALYVCPAMPASCYCVHCVATGYRYRLGSAIRYIFCLPSSFPPQRMDERHNLICLPQVDLAIKGAEFCPRMIIQVAHKPARARLCLLHCSTAVKQLPELSCGNCSPNLLPQRSFPP